MGTRFIQLFVFTLAIPHPHRERQARGKNNKKKRGNPELNILFQPMPENRPNQRAGCNVSPFEWGSGRATRKSNIRREKRCVAVWRWGRNEKKTARKRYDRRQGTSKLTDAGATFACLKRVTYTEAQCLAAFFSQRISQLAKTLSLPRENGKVLL